jgi:hypothetical protein
MEIKIYEEMELQELLNNFILILSLLSAKTGIHLKN